MEKETIQLLANKKILNKNKINNNSNDKNDDNHKNDDNDDNDEILELLKQRLELGKKKYGHGVNVNQDTTDFGTDDDDWELMALEEMLDGLIYTTASIIRYRRNKINNN